MTEAQILVVDDEVGMVTLLRNYLVREGYDVTTAPSAEVALQLLDTHEIDVVLTDLRMPGMGGMELVRELHAARPETQVILMTAFGSIDVAVEAVKAGAYHFVTKPVKLPEIGALVHKALAERALRLENRRLRQAVEDRYQFGELLGKSAVMQRLFGLLERLAATQSTVLIQGESGTGKELVARALHYHGTRRRHPFVPVNCAALPEGLLESELFGHTRGAFTGADLARRGLFLEATHGTLFLDEIGEMPLGMQAKLLRVLEQHQIRPVGSDREVTVDVRVIAATNRDLAQAVRQGTFREDLYYRLKVMVVQVPPLRAHRDDIPLLAETFLQRYTVANRLAPRHLTPSALRCLEQYDWPGNVRELAHVLERAVMLSPHETIDVEDLGLESAAASARLPLHLTDTAVSTAAPLADITLNLEELTRHAVTVALQQSHGHKGQAARLLGVHPRTLTRMLRRYGLSEAPLE
ncbi:MAG: sigma-54 dependent transcriptional regulator [candidate division KSB1 bacterium]|nr:sigma-54 dependent transcriptional regulator [candidate division KSB1 bacterium]